MVFIEGFAQSWSAGQVNLQYALGKNGTAQSTQVAQTVATATFGGGDCSKEQRVNGLLANDTLGVMYAGNSSSIQGNWGNASIRLTPIRLG
jgi:hypothetical protein